MAGPTTDAVWSLRMLLLFEVTALERILQLEHSERAILILVLKGKMALS